MVLDNPTALQQTAVKLLARREHSSAELRQKLLQKGALKDLIEPLLQRLQAANILNDARFAEVYARMRAGRGFGPLRIRAELLQRGVAGSYIDQALDSPELDWPVIAEQVRRKKFGRDIPQTFIEKAPQLKFLQYRGFIAEILDSR